MDRVGGAQGGRDGGARGGARLGLDDGASRSISAAATTDANADDLGRPRLQLALHRLGAEDDPKVGALGWGDGHRSGLLVPLLLGCLDGAGRRTFRVRSATGFGMLREDSPPFREDKGGSHPGGFRKLPPGPLHVGLGPEHAL